MIFCGTVSLSLHMMGYNRQHIRNVTGMDVISITPSDPFIDIDLLPPYLGIIQSIMTGVLNTLASF